MKMILFSILMIPMLAIIFAIPLLIGVYVYRDARRRRMNAVLWTLIAVFAPSLIGFIIYLLIRGNYSDMECPKCSTAITEQYVVCPKCGGKLCPSCPNCSTAVELDWTVCPKCATPLPEYQNDVVAPIRHNDKSLWKILLAIIIIPLFLIIVAIFSFSSMSSSGGTGVTSINIDDYLREVNNPQIEEWIDNIGEDYDKAYVLRHESTTSSKQFKVRYLIYMPRLVEQAQFSIGTSSGLFGRSIKLEFPDTNGNGGNTFILVTSNGEAIPKLKLYYGGKRVDCKITDVDYPLGLTDVETNIQSGTSLYD